ncbi:unnamed protein product [Toxocara canis]|uniref:Chondroitin proteoglycan 2 n=1 Tax=Toxocara canis TaxID=6265 RepID=A0A183URH8_TOXCA|nr:unnamed protein product [Toxocara canis]
MAGARLASEITKYSNVHSTTFIGVIDSRSLNWDSAEIVDPARHSLKHLPPELVNFCENKEDDVYSLGCVSKYIKCLAGATVLKRCPFKLVLDTTTKECTHRTDADVCRSSTFAEPTVTTTISTRAVPTTTTVPTEQAAPQGAYFVEYTNFCARKRNGNYALGCIRQYVTCANRRLAIRECAAKLIFSESSDRCVQWWKVEACRGLPTPSTEPPTTTSPVMSDIAQTGRTTVVTEGPGLPAASEASTAVTTTAVPDTTLDLLSTCVGQADGTYANGCSSEFIACVEGSASILRCSDSLVYDEKSHRCLGREYVEACGGSPPTVAVTEPAATEASTSFDVTESTTGEFACDALPDGMYARHCSSTFIACVGGQAIAMQCPAPLIYDPYVKQCAPKATVRNCNETGQFNGAFEAQPTVVNDLTQNILDEEALMPSPSSGPEFSCSGLPDGIYSEECSPVFVLCLAGNRTGARCPGHLKYDAVTQMCRRKNRVPGCMRPGAGVSTTPASGPSTTATATISEVQLDVAVSSTPVTWPTMSTEFSCTDLPDGVYAQGCSSQFVVCVARRAFLMTCPANMKYDDLSKRCLDEQEVPACQQLPMDVSTESRNGNFKVVAFSRVDFYVSSCVGRPDGMYGNGCSSEFTACVSGTATVMRCPANLKYDEKSRKCLYDNEVDACQTSVTSTTSTTPTTTTFLPTPQYDVITPLSTASTTTYPLPSDVSVCSVLPDGVYGQGCSPKFLVCSAKKTLLLSCPSSLAFDSYTRRCLPQIYVLACVMPSSEGTVSPTTRSTPSGVALESSSRSSFTVRTTRSSTRRTVEPTTIRRTRRPPTFATSESAETYMTPRVTRTPVSTTRFSFIASNEGATSASIQSPRTPSWRPCIGACGYMHEAMYTTTRRTTGPAAAPAMAPSVPLTRTATNRITQTLPTVTVPTATTAKDMTCAGRVDGPIAFGCSAVFVRCSFGAASFERCENDTKFDIVTRRCLKAGTPNSIYGPINYFAMPRVPPMSCLSAMSNVQVLMCNGATNPVERANHCNQYRNEDNITTSMSQGVPLLSAFSCEDHDDGLYDFGCSSNFVRCEDGEARYVRCPSFLRFDIVTSQCLDPAYVRACGGGLAASGRNETHVESSNGSDESDEPKIIVIVEKVVPKRGKKSKSPILKFPCEGLRDGHYAMGCSSVFASCRKGKTTFDHCPEGLKFDPDRRECRKESTGVLAKQEMIENNDSYRQPEA